MPTNCPLQTFTGCLDLSSESLWSTFGALTFGLEPHCTGTSKGVFSKDFDHLKSWNCLLEAHTRRNSADPRWMNSSCCPYHFALHSELYVRKSLVTFVLGGGRAGCYFCGQCRQDTGLTFALWCWELRSETFCSSSRCSISQLLACPSFQSCSEIHSSHSPSD